MKKVYKFLDCMYMPSRIFKNLLLVFFFLLVAGRGQAQNERPLVGLVLGGSGANGFANIGVLRVLEEQGIQPDFIVGTGFGALVGGMYAVGYKVDEIEKIVLNQDWNKLFVNRASYKALGIEEKEERERSILELYVTKDLEFKFGTGLNSGFKLYQFVSRLFFPAKNIDHFDFLPIPFRCVVTNQLSGDWLVRKQGNLAESIYTSLIMHSFLEPIYQDSSILIEGPVANPLPATVALEMGADIVIGTNIFYTLPESDTEDNTSALELLSYSGYANGRTEAENQVKLVDLLIEPDVDDNGIFSFDQIDDIIRSGEVAARTISNQIRSMATAIDAAGPAYSKDFYLDSSLEKNLTALETVAKSLAEIYIGYFLGKQDSTMRDSLNQQFVLDSIGISGINQFSKREVLKILELPIGEAVNPIEIQESIDRLDQLGEFTFIRYDIKNQENQNILHLECREKPPGKIRIGVFYNNYQQAGINLGFTSRNFILPGSRIKLAGSLNNYHRVQLEFLNYLDIKQRISYSLSGHYRQNLLPLVHEDEQTFRLDDLSFSNHWNLYLGSHTKFGIGLGWEKFNYTIEDLQIAPTFKKIEIRNLFTDLTLNVNSLDDPVLPQTGVRASLDYTYRLSQPFSMQSGQDSPTGQDSTGNFSPYHQVLINGKKMLPLSLRQVIDLTGFAGVSIGTTSPYQNHFVIGPPERLVERSLPTRGLNTYEWAATLAVGGSVAFQHFFEENLMAGIYFNGGYFELPNSPADSGNKVSGINYGVGGSIIYDTTIGPIRATISYLKSAEAKLAAGTRFFFAYGYRF